MHHPCIVTSPTRKGQNMSKCVDCGISMHMDITRCLSCQSKLRKAGICVWCAQKPTKSKRSKYCAECQAKAMMKRLDRIDSEPKRRPYRGQHHRENTHETKHG